MAERMEEGRKEEERDQGAERFQDALDAEVSHIFPFFAVFSSF